MSAHPTIERVRADFVQALHAGRLAAHSAAHAVGHLAQDGSPDDLEGDADVRELLLRVAWLLFVRAPALDGRYIALSPMYLSLLGSGQKTWEETFRELSELESMHEADDAELERLLRVHGDDLVALVREGIASSGTTKRVSTAQEAMHQEMMAAIDSGQWDKVPFADPDAELIREVLFQLDIPTAKNIVASWFQGDKHANDGKFAEANECYERAARFHPNFFETYLRRARTYYAADDRIRAGADVERAASLEPRAASPMAMKAELTALIRDMKGSLEHWNRALELAPECVPYRIRRGYTHIALGQHKLALVDFDAAVHLAPDDPTPLYNRAEARVRCNDLDGALADYDKLLSAHPEDVQALINRGTTKMMRKDPHGAIQDFDKALEVKPNYPNAYAKRAVAHATSDWWWEAYLDAVTALAVAGPEWSHHAETEKLVYKAISELDGTPHRETNVHDVDARGTWLADKTTGAAVIRFADHIDQYLPTERVGLHVFRGKTYALYAQWREALQAFGNALAVDPEHAVALAGMGNALVESHAFDKALEALDKARTHLDELDPDTSFVLHLAAGRAHGALQRIDEAIADFDAALAIKPTRADVWFYKGVHHDLADDKPAAIDAYGKSLQHDPTFSPAWFNRACEHAALGHKEAALEDLQQAAELKPSWAREAAADDYFKALWDDADFKDLVARYPSDNGLG